MSITELREFAEIVERQTKNRIAIDNMIKKQDELIKCGERLIKIMNDKKELNNQIAELNNILDNM